MISSLSDKYSNSLLFHIKGAALSSLPPIRSLPMQIRKFVSVSVIFSRIFSLICTFSKKGAKIPNFIDPNMPFLLSVFSHRIGEYNCIVLSRQSFTHL